MGKVYNAMVKADRWKDRARPIGRPDYDYVAIPVSDLEDAASDPSPIPWLGLDDAPFDDEPLPTATSLVTDRLRADLFGDRGAPRLRVAGPAAAPQLPSFTEPRRQVNIASLSPAAHMAAFNGGDPLAAERYRTLAVRLMNLGARRKLKSVLVTSAREGEGKSTVAANLAWVMAKPGERRVLLLDADVRHPAIAELIGLRPEHGWMDVLERNLSVSDALVGIDPNGLYTLSPSAASDSHTALVASASDALTSSRAERLLQEFERYFDFIIIDAPPILEFADAQRLASMADGAIMVVRAEQTPPAAVTDALKLIPKDRRVGVVLNESELDEEIAYHKRKTSRRWFGRNR